MCISKHISHTLQKDLQVYSLIVCVGVLTLKFPSLKFLAMTEKNNFVYKLFLSLNISDFSLFFIKNCNAPEKGHPLFPSNTIQKLQSCQAHQLFENLVGGSTLEQEVRVPTMSLKYLESIFIKTGVLNKPSSLLGTNYHETVQI